MEGSRRNAALHRVEELMQLVTTIRLGVRELLLQIANYHSRGISQQVIKAQVSAVEESIKKLNDATKKLEETLKANSERNLVFKDGESAALKDIKDRASQAAGVLEAQLRVRFAEHIPQAQGAKRRKLLSPTEAGDQDGTPPARGSFNLEKFLPEAEKLTHFHLKKVACLPLGDGEQLITLHFVCRQVFSGWVQVHEVAGRVEVSNVVVVAADEATEEDINNLAQPVHSRSGVFRRVSEHAAEAVRYYGTHFGSDLALLRVLLWLSFYRTLFERRCTACGKLLRLDAPSTLLLPPTFRSFDAGHPYHSACRPR